MRLDLTGFRQRVCEVRPWATVGDVPRVGGAGQQPAGPAQRHAGGRLPSVRRERGGGVPRGVQPAGAQRHGRLLQHEGGRQPRGGHSQPSSGIWLPKNMN